MLALSGSSANADEYWMCIYDVDDAHPFKVRGDFIAHGDWLLIVPRLGHQAHQARILRNDADLLIAADSLSWNSPIGGPTSSASLTVIDKKRGTYKETSIYLATDGLSGPDSSSGSCKVRNVKVWINPSK